MEKIVRINSWMFSTSPHLLLLSPFLATSLLSVFAYSYPHPLPGYLSLNPEVQWDIFNTFLIPFYLYSSLFTLCLSTSIFSPYTLSAKM